MPSAQTFERLAWWLGKGQEKDCRLSEGGIQHCISSCLALEEL
jgi:hypothetical protein